MLGIFSITQKSSYKLSLIFFLGKQITISIDSKKCGASGLILIAEIKKLIHSGWQIYIILMCIGRSILALMFLLIWLVVWVGIL